MTTPTHLDGLAGCPLDRSTPFGMTNVSTTQLSIARHYGGIKFNGARYTYFPDTDELVRDDVLRWLVKMKRKPRLPQPDGGKLARASKSESKLKSGN